MRDGALVGAEDGFFEGGNVSFVVGLLLGLSVGAPLGLPVGMWVGAVVGAGVGFLDGDDVGFRLGFLVGTRVGVFVGAEVGFAMGDKVGFLVFWRFLEMIFAEAGTLISRFDLRSRCRVGLKMVSFVSGDGFIARTLVDVATPQTVMKTASDWQMRMVIMTTLAQFEDSYWML